MSQSTLPPLPSADFAQQLFRDMCTLNRVLYAPPLGTCQHEDHEGYPCRRRATVFNLETELEFCPQHESEAELG